MSNIDPPAICTIGHSTRPIPEFVELLALGAVTMVVDVRTVPRSRTNPQNNSDSLPGALAPWSIGYVLIPELGGLRGRASAVPAEVNGFWQNRSFHNYADYALSDGFDAGLRQLLTLSATQKCAIMCAEAVWWRCHRRIIADYLILHGRRVMHLLGTSRIEPAAMTPSATPSDGRLLYPAGPAAPTRRTDEVTVRRLTAPSGSAGCGPGRRGTASRSSALRTGR